MQYIGDAKAGSLIGKDQYVPIYCRVLLNVHLECRRFGNRYFENRNPEEEIPGGYNRLGGVNSNLLIQCSLRRPTPMG
jgi:hypothetical protein